MPFTFLFSCLFRKYIEYVPTCCSRQSRQSDRLVFFLFILFLCDIKSGQNICDCVLELCRVIGTPGVQRRHTLDNTASIEVAGTAAEEEPVPGERRRGSAARPRRS